MSSVHATHDERMRRLPGDEVIPAPIGAFDHAITIDRPRRDVWPWLVQMGAGRAGWYSYDALDNGGRPSADRIVAEWQGLTPGMLFPALPGATDGFTLLGFDRERSLVLGWSTPEGEPLVTWAFVLEDAPDESTRLIVRVRGGRGYRFHGLPWWLARPIVAVVHSIMERKQLLGIAERAELARAGGGADDRSHDTRPGRAPAMPDFRQ